MTTRTTNPAGIKIKMGTALTALVALLAAAYLFGGGGGPDTARSRQGRVIRAEVTMTEGPFSVTLTTESSLNGRRDWVPSGRTYTGTFAQDILLVEGERMRVWLTGAADIDREVEKRVLSCQIYDNGKALPPPGFERLPVRRGEAGEPVTCTALVVG